MILWEIPFMPARFAWFRAAMSLPLPFLAAAIAMGDREAVSWHVQGVLDMIINQRSAEVP
jgi:hypothetical protein